MGNNIVIRRKKALSLHYKSNGIMRLIVSELEIKAMSLCVIVSQFEDKSNGGMCKEEAKVRIVAMLSSHPNDQKEVSFLPI